MLNWKILIVEDQVATAMDIQSELEEMGFRNIAVYYDCESAIKEIKAGKRMPDLAILDINLGENKKTGIEMAQFLNSKKIIPIIYLTGEASDENFLNALETFPAQFIEKPFNARKLKRSINLATAAHQNPIRKQPIEFLFVKKRVDAFGKKAVKVFVENILWLAASQSCVDLYTETATHKGIENTLTDFNDAVKFPNLLQVHRSFLINCNKIDAIDINYKFVTIKEKRIPISGSFRDVVKKRMPLL